jgi:hypothetical protein
MKEKARRLAPPQEAMEKINKEKQNKTKTKNTPR